MDKEKLEIQKNHRKSMEIAEEAFFMERKRDFDKEKLQNLFQKAFELEKKAADMTINLNLPKEEVEPTRSVLCVSAANLAMSAGDKESEKEYRDKARSFGYMSEEEINR